VLKYGAVSGLSMIAGNDTPKQVPTGGWSAPVLMGAACLATGSAAATAWGLEVVARAASCGFVAAELNPACTCSTWTRLALLQLQ
jgi:glycerol uptake facilitator-like aquaporin